MYIRLCLTTDSTQQWSCLVSWISFRSRTRPRDGTRLHEKETPPHSFPSLVFPLMAPRARRLCFPGYPSASHTISDVGVLLSTTDQVRAGQGWRSRPGHRTQTCP
ncbi:hypothetical protein VTG60DRAFT_5046 [Thermothelomyces hinnuleus]